MSVTIGQLSAASAVTSADYVEIEQSGVSKHAPFSTVIAGIVSTSAQSLLGSSDTVVMTPNQTRVALNANNSAPIYACRAWVNFNGTTTSSSITGTFTRSSGTTLTYMTATAHGCITNNLNVISGGVSTNSYLATVINADLFTINTVSTSSATGSFTITRCPISSAGNVGSVCRSGAGYYIINFSVALPDAYYTQALASASPAYFAFSGDGTVPRTKEFSFIITSPVSLVPQDSGLIEYTAFR